MLEGVLASLKAKVGEDHVDYLRNFEPLARCDIADGRPEAAVLRLENLLELEKAKPHFDGERGEAHRTLAAALWALGRREAALAAARTAFDEFSADPETRAAARQTDAWLRAHGGGSGSKH